MSGSKRISHAATIKKMVWNELLAYIAHYCNNSSLGALSEIVSKHFLAEDVSEAKRIMMQEFQSVPAVNQFSSDRRQSAERSARDAEIEDIAGALHAVDEDHSLVLESYAFVASDLKQQPKYEPEEINIAVVVGRQSSMEASTQQLMASVHSCSICRLHQHQCRVHGRSLVSVNGGLTK